MQQSYENFSAEQLATDPAFIAWIKQPDPANTARWQDWLAKHPGKADEVRLARHLVDMWRIVEPVPAVGSQATVWAGIQAHKNESAGPRPADRSPIRIGQSTYLRRVAAGLAGLAILVAVVLWTARDRGMTQYTTRADQTRTVTLPDGSTVVLNANSSVRFASVWTADQPREVSLTGEGFFTVMHHKNHRKFVVETPSHLRVEVLGTVFTIDERTRQTRVVLNQGQVRLYLADQPSPILMKPGELVEVPATRQETIVRRRVTPEVYSAWTAHQFVFDNTSLAEIARILEQDLGYTVQFGDSRLADRRMTIRLPNQDVDLLLAAVAEAHDLTITRPDAHVIRLETAHN